MSQPNSDKPMKVRKLIIPLVALTLCAGVVLAQSTRRSKIKPVKTLPPDTTLAMVHPGGAADTITTPLKFNRIVKISDFNKPVSSRVESVLISNLSATDTIKKVVVDIDYRTLKGKQLNRRLVSYDVTVPPGETRHAAVDSWDKQQLFYYKDNPPARRSQRSTAFKINITPKSVIISPLHPNKQSDTE